MIYRIKDDYGISTIFRVLKKVGGKYVQIASNDPNNSAESEWKKLFPLPEEIMLDTSS